MKRFLKSALAISLCFIMLCSSFAMGISASAETVESGKCGDNVYWTLDDEGTLTISGTGKMYNNYSYSDSPWYKDKEKIKTLIIENGITNICDYAFNNCSGITSVVIPDSVTSIGYTSFSRCSSLNEITIPNSVTSISNNAFDFDSLLVVMCNKESYTNDYCKKNSVDYVLIDDDTDRYITGTVGTKLSWSIDKRQRTLTINCNGNMPPFSNNAAPWKSHSKYFLTAEIEGDCTSVSDYAFEHCTSLISVNIPDSVTSIGSLSFFYCLSLTNITLPNSLTVINRSAFSNCKNLSSITIPKNVWFIGALAFSHCENLIEITIPESVKYIESGAFEYCVNVIDVTLPYSIDTIYNDTFSNCALLDKIYIFNRKCRIADSAIPYNVTIYSFKNSEAETFANKNGYFFEIIDDLHEHIYDYKCDEKCNLCGDIREVNHSYLSEITKQPNCTEKGIVVYSCSVCANSYTLTIPKLGHEFGAYVSNDDATCLMYGTKTAKCTVCGITNTVTDIESKLPHTSSNLISESEIAPTCIQAGTCYEVIYCLVCNEELSRTFKFIPALGHNDINKDGYCDVCKTVTDADLANPCRNAKINIATAKSVDYKAQVTIKATASGVPAGYSLAIYVNGKQVAKGSNTEVTYTVGQATSDINYTVKVIDAKGNVQKDSANKDLAKDGGKITVNSGFFAKIIAFFKSLFGSLSKVEVKP